MGKPGGPGPKSSRSRSGSGSGSGNGKGGVKGTLTDDSTVTDNVTDDPVTYASGAECVPPQGGSMLRHSGSENEGDGEETMGEGEGGKGKAAGKRFKPGSPPARRAGGQGEVFVEPRVPVLKPVRRKVPKVAEGGLGSLGSLASVAALATDTPISGPCGAHSAIGRMKAVTTELNRVLLEGRLDSETAMKILSQVGRYEEVLMTVVGENERLRGRLDVLDAAGGTPSVREPRVVESSLAKPPFALLTHAPVAPKPVETWSVVVRSKTAAVPKEVVHKVVNQVGPTLGVRVHEVKEVRSGGAVIRTPSVAERERIARNPKFGEVGLEVSVNEKLGPRVVVQRVHSEITLDEFMGDLYEMNLKDVMTPEAFKRGIKLVSRPWKVGTGGAVDVILEGHGNAMESLLNVGRCYIKWFSFRVRSHDLIPSCFRCLGFDHMVRECRMSKEVCRRCGQSGHVSFRCNNSPHCRNCAFKGLPSGHLMMSEACPTYSTLVARARARH